LKFSQTLEGIAVDKHFGVYKNEVGTLPKNSVVGTVIIVYLSTRGIVFYLRSEVSAILRKTFFGGTKNQNGCT
jgi:hypothetical protein